jgi:uncharacterized damage-inducible protein DinB
MELGWELSRALERIRHCIDQLTDGQVWRRPAAGMNSVGHLLLHLTGNVRQWVVSGLGGAPDDRDRPAEFAETQPVPKADLWEKLRATVEEATAVLAAQTEAGWRRPRRIQGFEVTGLRAAINSVAHFQGHTQEIIHLTRAVLGDRYCFAWTPATKEQGAE